MNKKIVLILIGAILMLAIIAIIPKDVNAVLNAAVNPENGDIAFAVPDDDGRTTMLRITLCDKNGEVLFSKKFLTNLSSVGIKYYENHIYICVGRMDRKIYCFDRNGCSVDGKYLPEDEIYSEGVFAGWESSFGKYSYSLGEYKYQYYAPTIFRHHAELTILNGENIKVVYQSYP